MKPPVGNADQTQKYQSKKIAKDHGSESADMTEVEDLSKKKKPPVRNADQTQKNQTKEVADNDDSDTADTMSESEDMSWPMNRKMPRARNVQQKKCLAIQEQKKIKNHISNRAPLNQNVDNGSDEGHN